MKMLVIAVVLAVVSAAAVSVRKALLRNGRIRRVQQSEAAVAKAIEEGRLSQSTGEALLQHLEGLRRECSGWGEGRR